MYLKASIVCKTEVESASEIVMALLEEFPFHTFSEDENMVFAFGEKDSFTEQDKVEISSVLNNFANHVSFEIQEKKNWNEEWEKNYFKPIWIDNEVCVFAPFHKLDKTPQIPIVIEPKMSFGTGHHTTTHLMCSAILKYRAQMQGSRILDMGAGTGILAILAAKLGASHVHAIDIEEWCMQNATENFERNGIEFFQSDVGNAALLKDTKNPYKIIFANIQRNVLLEDMGAYCEVLAKNGYLFISGFPPEDAMQLIKQGNNLGLNHLETSSKGEWCCLIFKQQAK